MDRNDPTALGRACRADDGRGMSSPRIGNLQGETGGRIVRRRCGALILEGEQGEAGKLTATCG